MNKTRNSIAKIIHPFYIPGGCETMAYRVYWLCINVTTILTFLLILQPVDGQRNVKPLPGQEKFSDLDGLLVQKQKELGKDFVVMLWKKDDTLVFKKELGEFNTK